MQENQNQLNRYSSQQTKCIHIPLPDAFFYYFSDFVEERWISKYK
jgi:hypothetical protein